MEFTYEANRIFTQDHNGTLMGEIVFPTLDEATNTVLIERTFVNPSARGQGLAALLVAKFYEYAAANHLQVKLLCPYAKRQFNEHHEYQQLLVDQD